MKGENMTSCAHCEMSLSKTSRNKKIKGKMYYFCSNACEALFEKTKRGKKIDYKKVFERGLQANFYKANLEISSQIARGCDLTWL